MPAQESLWHKRCQSTDSDAAKRGRSLECEGVAVKNAGDSGKLAIRHQQLQADALPDRGAADAQSLRFLRPQRRSLGDNSRALQCDPVK